MTGVLHSLHGCTGSKLFYETSHTVVLPISTSTPPHPPPPLSLAYSFSLPLSLTRNQMQCPFPHPPYPLSCYFSSPLPSPPLLFSQYDTYFIHTHTLALLIPIKTGILLDIFNLIFKLCFKYIFIQLIPF